MKLKIRSEYLTNLHFLGENFFQAPQENIIYALRTFSKYGKGKLTLDLVLYVVKKIGTVRHTNQILCQEKRVKLRF